MESSSRNWGDLPEEIIQHIQSFLYEKEGEHREKTFVRSSLVSKAWLCAWSTHPCLTFRYDSSSWRKSRDQLAETLSRYVLCDFNLKRFRLYVNGKSLPSNLDRWLDMARTSGVEDVSLCSKFSLTRSVVCPQKVFDVTKTLQSLSLHRFRICVDDNINICCFSLKNLKLEAVNIDDRTMNNFLCSCPLIETLMVSRSDGFKKINVTGLRRLRVFEFGAIKGQNQTVEISDGANISSSLAYNGDDGLFQLGASACHWNTLDGRYKYLTCLKLSSLDITDVVFNEFSSRIPFLDDLSLEYCESLERINLAFNLLSRLTIQDCCKIKEVRIDAPVLRTLDYRVKVLPEFVFRNVSQRQLEYASLTSHTTGRQELGISWFLNLSVFLKKFRMSDIWVEITDKKERNDLEALRVASFPLRENIVRSLTLCNLYFTRTAEHLELVMESFLAICRPKYISLRGNKVEYIKFLLKKLDDERQNPSCCVDHEIKCWRHYLHDVKMRYLKPKVEENDEQYHEIRQGKKRKLQVFGIKLEWVS